MCSIFFSLSLPTSLSLSLLFLYQYPFFSFISLSLTHTLSLSLSLSTPVLPHSFSLNFQKSSFLFSVSAFKKELSWFNSFQNIQLNSFNTILNTCFFFRFLMNNILNYFSDGFFFLFGL